jgi:hypothetical protein
MFKNFLIAHVLKGCKVYFIWGFDLLDNGGGVKKVLSLC